MKREQAMRSKRVLVLVVVAMAFCGLMSASAVAAPAPAWQVLGAIGPTNLPPEQSEIQELYIVAEGGTFTLSFGAATTPALDFDAAPAEIESGLNGLSTIGGIGGAVSVTGGGSPGDPFTMSFGGSLANQNVNGVTSNGSTLSGVAAEARVETPLQGGAGSGMLVIYATNVGGAPTTSPVNVNIGPLPTGIVTSGTGSGAGWACLPAGAGQQIVSCSNAAVVSPLAVTSALRVPLEVTTASESVSSVEIEAEGGGASGPGGSDVFTAPVVVSKQDAEPGIQALWAGAFRDSGEMEVAAGAHPYSAGTFFLVNTIRGIGGEVAPAGDLRDISVELPPGFIANPMITNRCPQAMPVVYPNPGPDSPCTQSSDVGNAVPLIENFTRYEGGISDVYNGEPEKGFAAGFAFKVGNTLQRLVGEVRSDQDFGITGSAYKAVNIYKLYGAYTMLEGFPGGANGKPFLSNPTACGGQGGPLEVVVRSNTYQWPVSFFESSDAQPTVVGCDQLTFAPQFTFDPSSTSAATGVAANAHVQVNQEGLTSPAGFATPHLKDSVVVLPEGVNLNPAAANGLEACSTSQIGLKGTNFAAPNPIRFDKSPVTCPDGSKIGTVEVETPLLEEPLAGIVYLAAQDDNPFKSLLAMYLVVEDAKTGTILKLPGKVTPNSKTGQLTAEFDNNPQIPFEDLTLKFRGGGPQSTLATPDVCGKYTTKGTFTPWSAPESGPPATTEDSFDITTGVGGSASCPQTKAQRPFGLGFEAGTTATQAGGDSPFTLRVTRPDGNQELDKIVLKMPLGLTAKLAGVTMCSDAELAQAMAPGRDGKTEMEKPSCPANSQVGTTTIGAGVGSQPFYVKTGKVYLTGPYKGAPIGLAFVVPAVAGPFDLGVQVVRTALQVNPTTAEITAVSDPIPQILEGIPLQIRDVRVDIDRPGFTRNPTSCEPMAVSGQITGGSGAVANVNNRFQVGNCGALGFSPKLQLTYKGQTKVGGNPALRAVLTQPAGEANIAYTQVVLPNGSFIDNEHINNPCTRDQWAANACPASSILGTATAYSPLLDQPLTGYVYFKSNGGERELPDIVASLKGQVNVDLVGFIDAIENKKKETSRVRNTFAIVPDAPVTRFELNMKGGKFGLIENSKNLCKNRGKNKATVRMTAHNGKRVKLEPVIKTSCRKPKPKGGKGGKKGRADQRGHASAELGRMHR